MFVTQGGAKMVDNGYKIKMSYDYAKDERMVRYYREKTPRGLHKCGYVVALVFNSKDLVTRAPLASFGCDTL